MSSVVVATPDVVGARMAGPGIRAWHFALELAKRTSVTLIARREGDAPAGAPGITMVERGSAEARDALAEARVLIGQPARGFRKLRSGQHIVFDMFDPTVLELRELYGRAPSLRQRLHLAAEWSRLSYALIRADLLIAATPQQRRFYDSLHGGDASWIEIPFGVEMDLVRRCPQPQANVVIWGGGVWEWLDPATAVEATLKANADGVACKLLFLGRTRPNRNLIDRRRDDRFELLLQRGGPFVDANADWIPYAERLSWLRSGKAAIMLHRPTAEAEYAIRTRLFDAIAAAVPVIASAGGFAAELVSREGLGIVVSPGDVDAAAAAIKRLLTDDAFHARCVQRIERIRPSFAWDRVVAPLVDKVTEWLKLR